MKDLDIIVSGLPFAVAVRLILGLVADVITHWKGKLLQQTIDQCKTSSSVETCPPLAAIKDTAQREACRPLGTGESFTVSITAELTALQSSTRILAARVLSAACSATILYGAAPAASPPATVRFRHPAGSVPIRP